MVVCCTVYVMTDTWKTWIRWLPYIQLPVMVDVEHIFWRPGPSLPCSSLELSSSSSSSQACSSHDQTRLPALLSCSHTPWWAGRSGWSGTWPPLPGSPCWTEGYKMPDLAACSQDFSPPHLSLWFSQHLVWANLPQRCQAAQDQSHQSLFLQHWGKLGSGSRESGQQGPEGLCSEIICIERS